MDREIKFRAWNYETGEMMYNSFGVADNGRWWQFADQGYLVNDKDEGEDEFSLMQYTGLKDKNGQDIYEGDILECECFVDVPEENVFNEPMQYNNAIVKFDNEVACFFASFENEGGQYDWVMLDDLLPHKIIGNIYENPELLDNE